MTSVRAISNFCGGLSRSDPSCRLPGERGCRMAFKSKSPKDPRWLKEIFLSGLIFVGLVACSQVSQPTPTPPVTPAAQVISPESVPYLSLKKSFGGGIAKAVAWAPD